MIQKILFICPEPNRTGAPILLLNLLKWLKLNSTISFDILLLTKGELESDFKNVSSTYQLEYVTNQTLIKRILYRLVQKKSNKKELIESWLRKTFKNKGYTHIFGNTILSADVLLQMSKMYPNSKLLLHIHELQNQTFKFKSQLDDLLSKNLHIIAVSKLTRDNLLFNHNIKSSSISLVYEYIDISNILSYSQQVSTNAEYFTVNSSGSVQSRKGYDIFILIAFRCVQKFPNVPFRFRWIGNIHPDLLFLIKHDLESTGLSEIVEFIGLQKNPYNEYQKGDVFLLTSRLDPFPLVCLEHALLKKPIVCFDKGTGITEFVESDAGIIVTYLDIDAVADALFMLYQNTSIRSKITEVAYRKVQNYDVNYKAKEILNIILNA